MKGDTLLIIELTAILTAFGFVSFFWTPVYATGVGLVTGILIEVLKLTLAYKFGRSMPQQRTDPAKPEPPKPEPPQV